MSESEIDIVVKCRCGRLLTEVRRETETLYGDRLAITVESCEDCIEEAVDASFDDGYDKQKAEIERLRTENKRLRAAKWLAEFLR